MAEPSFISIPSLTRSLKQQQPVRELTDSHIELLSGCTKNVHFSAGDYLFREGSTADWLYLLRKGQVSLEIHAPTRGRTVVERLHTGDLMGWTALFPPYVWHVDARARKDTLAFAIHGDCLRTKLDADPSFGYAVTKMVLGEVHRRLERVRLQSLDVYRAGS